MSNSPRLRDYGRAKRCLGHGAYGSVYLYKQSDRRVAIKKISLSDEEYCKMLQNETEVNDDFEESFSSLITEAVSYSYLDSQYILKPYAIARDQLQLAIVMPLSRYDLTEYISQCEVKGITDHKRFILLQVARGIYDAHQANILNLDIKPGNVLVMRDGSIKLADWGKAQLEYCSHPHLVHVDTGTSNCNPPERLLEFDQHTPAYDVWSFGVLVYALYYHTWIFKGDSSLDVLKQIIKRIGPLPIKMSKQYYKIRKRKRFPSSSPRTKLQGFAEINDPTLVDLLERIFVYEPEHRITMYQIMQHPHFHGWEKITEVNPDRTLRKLARRVNSCPPVPNKDDLEQRFKLLERFLNFAHKYDISYETCHLAINIYDRVRYHRLCKDWQPVFTLIACLYHAEIITSEESCSITTYRQIIPAKTINVNKIYDYCIIIGQVLNWKLAPTTAFHWLMYFRSRIDNEEMYSLVHKLAMISNLGKLYFKYTSLDLTLTIIAWGYRLLEFKSKQDPILDLKIIIPKIQKLIRKSNSSMFKELSELNLK